MRPKQAGARETPELFRARRENLIDRQHPLARLAELIDWRAFEESFGPLYQERVGRPGLPTRLMVGPLRPLRLPSICQRRCSNA
jgi:IS5 family transposase